MTRLREKTLFIFVTLQQMAGFLLGQQYYETSGKKKRIGNIFTNTGQMATKELLNLAQIKSFTKSQLQSFLKIRQKPTSVNKPELIQRPILF